LSPGPPKVGWTEMAGALIVAGALSPEPPKVGWTEMAGASSQ